MEIQTFLSETATRAIPVADLTVVAANRAAFGDDVLAGFTTQAQLRSTQAQAVLDAAQQAGRVSLLACEQRS